MMAAVYFFGGVHFSEQAFEVDAVFVNGLVVDGAEPPLVVPGTAVPQS